MTWWHRRKTDENAEVETMKLTDADQAIRDASQSTERVDRLAQAVAPGLRRLEAHRRENHVLDAMMETLGRRG